MKRILITAKSLDIGGIERALLFLLKKFNYQEYKIDLFLLKKGPLDNCVPKEVNIIYYNHNVDAIKKYRLKKNIFIKKILKTYPIGHEKNYDAAIAFDGFDNYADLYAVFANSKKKIIWVHNDFLNLTKSKRFSTLYKIMYKIMSNKFRLYDNIVCVSKGAQENFCKMFPKYKNKTSYIYNFIDTKEIKELSNKTTKIRLTGNFNIVGVGRMVKSKNFEKLIGLHTKLKKDIENLKTYIIGDGPEFENLNKIIKRQSLEKEVILLGKLSNPYNIMKQADVLVSFSKFESAGIILLESAVLGIPYITINNMGGAEITQKVLADYNGYVAEESEIKEIVLSLYSKKRKHEEYNFTNYNKEIIKKIFKLISN